MNVFKGVDFGPEMRDKVNEAVKIILSGVCDRVDVTKTVKVYKCANVIRIDLKITEEVNDYVCE